MVQFTKAKEKAKIQEEFMAYEVMWECNKGHKNFQTVMDKGTQQDVCLECGQGYEYEFDKQ